MMNARFLVAGVVWKRSADALAITFAVRSLGNRNYLWLEMLFYGSLMFANAIYAGSGNHKY